MIYEILTTIGISLDIIGVWLLSSVLLLSKEEILNATDAHWASAGKSIDEKFENAKNRPFVKSLIKQKRKGIIGLIIVTIGFSLQILALWL